MVERVFVLCVVKNSGLYTKLTCSECRVVAVECKSEETRACLNCYIIEAEESRLVMSIEAHPSRHKVEQ